MKSVIEIPNTYLPLIETDYPDEEGNSQIDWSDLDEVEIPVGQYEILPSGKIRLSLSAFDYDKGPDWWIEVTLPEEEWQIDRKDSLLLFERAYLWAKRKMLESMMETQYEQE
jgi:hypothetical protein